MQILEGLIDNREIVLIYQGEDRPCHLYVRLTVQDFSTVRLDDEFPNPSKASAFLVSELGYRDACAFLNQHGIPKSSQLWNLNHNGPPPEDTDPRS